MKGGRMKKIYIILLSLVIIITIITLYYQMQNVIFIKGQITQICSSGEELYLEISNSNRNDLTPKIITKWLNTENGKIRKEKVLSLNPNRNTYGAYFHDDYLSPSIFNEIYYNTENIHFFVDNKMFFALKIEDYAIKFSLSKYCIYEPENEIEFFKIINGIIVESGKESHLYAKNYEMNQFIYLEENSLKCVDIISTYNNKKESIIWERDVKEKYDTYTLQSNSKYLLLTLLLNNDQYPTKMYIYDIKTGSTSMYLEKRDLYDTCLSEDNKFRYILCKNKIIDIYETDIKNKNEKKICELLCNDKSVQHIQTEKQLYKYLTKKSIEYALKNNIEPNVFFLNYENICSGMKYKGDPIKKYTITSIKNKKEIEIEENSSWFFPSRCILSNNKYYLFKLYHKYYYVITKSKIKKIPLAGIPIQIIENKEHFYIACIGAFNYKKRYKWTWADYQRLSCIYKFKK